MTIPFWCLLVAVFMPYVLAGVAGYFKAKQFGTIDARHPRTQAAALTGTGARAYAAQSNAWEALAVFTAAVVVAHLAGADPGRSATAALVFLGARIAHPIAYVADFPTLRTVSFVVGLVACLWLFWVAATA
jgi:uncharacterized MAPEG superfamily protein